MASGNVCYNWQQSGNCKFGSQCRYAHGDEQPAAGAQPSNAGGSSYRRSPSAPCYNFQETGSCKFGSNCRFSHGDDQVRSPQSGGARNSYRSGGGSGPCYEFRDNGSCRYGDQCRFNHGNASSGGDRRPTGICRQFEQTGNCTYGAQCRFSHTTNVDNGSNIDVNMSAGQPAPVTI